ncbi:MAG: aldehyde dehydrogenase family protein, partial [Planctomycetota bacterium]|nr:aldehyde dehydrogenase family protein [Planctomycetota bacterium]
MPNAIPTIPVPENEPVLGFLPGSLERKTLNTELKRLGSEPIEIPLIIGGQEVRTGITVDAVVPHDHGHVLAKVHQAGPEEVAEAIRTSVEAQHDWSRMPYEARAAIFLKAADLLAGPWRKTFNASTMLNQSKTCHQAEIDASCELIDFFKFNCMYMQQIYQQVQPPVPGGGAAGGVWNQVECRPLEGFVYSITPFNFTSIAANLPHAPVLMGGVSVWKPSPSSLF